MPVMHTAIPCTGNTADQAVSTVHLQLGAAKHLTRPLTKVKPSLLLSTRFILRRTQEKSFLKFGATKHSQKKL